MMLSLRKYWISGRAGIGAIALLAGVVVIAPFHPVSEVQAVGSAGLIRHTPSISAIGTGAGSTGEVSTTTVQSDGKILLGGNFTEWNGVATTGLVRLNADYSVDTSFLTNVASAPTHTAAFYPIRSITPLPDGDIWITGEFSSWSGNIAKGLVRLNADGTFDTAFTAWPSGANTSGNFTALATQSDGSLIVAIPSGASWHPSGSSYCKPDSTCSIGRITPQLAKDTSFNTNGGAPNGTVTQIKVQSDDKVVVAGSFSSVSGSGIADATTGRGVVRFNANGSRDTSFNANAVLATISGFVRGLGIQSTGKIVAVGEFNMTINAVSHSTKIIRFNTDGTIDNDFFTAIGGPATGGFRCVNSTGCSSVKPFSLAVLPGDGLAVGGFFNGYGGTVDANLVGPGLVLLNSDGTLKAGLDRAVNDGNYSASTYSGVKWARSGAHEANAVRNVMSVAVTPSGQIIAGGDFKHWANTGCESGSSTTSATEICETNVGRVVVMNVQMAPTVTSVSPSSGASSGGTSVTVTGANFAQNATVTVGGSACVSVVIVNATTLTCSTPSGTAGTSDIVVTNSVGFAGNLVAGFTYVAAPTVVSATPQSGASTGATSLTITGTGFLTGATVSIGGTGCISVVVVSATSITCTSPAHASGVVNVRVTNTDGQYGELLNGFTYTTTTSTTTTTTTIVSPTTVPSSSGASVASGAAPMLVTSSNKAALEATPGSAVAVINGQAVAVETVKVQENASAAAQQAVAKEIVAEITKLLPAGATNSIKVVKTTEGAELSGLMVNPEDPTEKLNVPIDSVTLVKAGNAAVLISALNQTNLPAEVSGGVIEVTRGGIVSARAYGLPGSQSGEIVLMSTPRLLKTFTVSADGSYNGQVPLPTDIAFGSHTIVMATANAKMSLGINLVRTKMQFRIKRSISTKIFKNRAGVKKAGGKVTITGAGRCKASLTTVKMSAKAGPCYVTVKQAAKGKYPAVNYRFTVQVVTKLIKKKK